MPLRAHLALAAQREPIQALVVPQVCKYQLKRPRNNLLLKVQRHKHHAALNGFVVRHL
jgi:hypothetical protein